MVWDECAIHCQDSDIFWLIFNLHCTSGEVFYLAIFSLLITTKT